MNDNINDFIEGQRDCKEGNAPKENPSDNYLSGYNFQYQLEQSMGYFTDEHF